MENEMTIMDNTLHELQAPMAIGEIFAKSGMFPDVKSQAQAVVKILAGRELGLTPFEAMGGLYLVGGKLTLTSKIMSGLVKRHPDYDYVIDKLDDTEATLTFYKKGKELGVSTFTIKDAAKAGLVNKDVWKAYPRNMLLNRAISNGCRWFCPEVISGYYSTEEIEDLGEMVTTAPAKTTVTIDMKENQSEVINET